MINKTSPHLLVVDDDQEIRQLLGAFLRQHNYRVSEAKNAHTARQQLATGNFDLIVLDIMMPGEDGLSLCRWLADKHPTPTILLSALSEETDRIIGLEMGADDYLCKPFNPRELLARVRSVLRRSTSVTKTSNQHNAEKICFDQWIIDTTTRELHHQNGKPAALTSGEYKLLLAFVTHPERLLTRDQLLDLTRSVDGGPFDRSIDVQLSRLRKKIEQDPKSPKLIKTIRNGGYIFSTRVTHT